MINTKQMGMVKESLLYLYRRDFRFIDIPVYFCDNNDVSQEDITTSIKSLQEFDELPWPSHNCIFIGVNPWRKGDKFTQEMGTEHLLYILLKIDFKPKGLQPVDIEVEQQGETVIDAEYKYYMLISAYLNKRIYIREMPLYLARAHSVNWTREEMEKHAHDYAEVEAMIGVSTAYGLELIKKIDSVTRKFSGVEIPELPVELRPQVDECIDDLTQFYRACIPDHILPGDRQWVASTSEEDLLTFCLATQVLSCFTTMIVPCHYMVKSDWGEGFGEKRFKRKIAGKPFFSLVNYNRLYREAVKGDSDIQRQPHFRRGHVRYLWKEAGINRHLLPHVASERMRLAVQHNVRKVYVTPSWIGPKHFSSSGYKYEILTGEIPW